MMIEETVSVAGFSEVSERMKQISAEWAEICRDELADAAATVLRSAIIPVTPKSSLWNPIYRTEDGKDVLPEYKGIIGKNTLRNDFNIKVQSDGSIQVGFSQVQYAKKVHEMTGAVNWSTPGTGAKYLDTPIEQNIDKVAEEAATNIDLTLKRKGLTT